MKFIYFIVACILCVTFISNIRVVSSDDERIVNFEKKINGKFIVKDVKDKVIIPPAGLYEYGGEWVQINKNGKEVPQKYWKNDIYPVPLKEHKFASVSTEPFLRVEEITTGKGLYPVPGTNRKKWVHIDDEWELRQADAKGFYVINGEVVYHDKSENSPLPAKNEQQTNKFLKQYNTEIEFQKQQKRVTDAELCALTKQIFDEVHAELNIDETILQRKKSILMTNRFTHAERAMAAGTSSQMKYFGDVKKITEKSAITKAIIDALSSDDKKPMEIIAVRIMKMIENMQAMKTVYEFLKVKQLIPATKTCGELLKELWTVVEYGDRKNLLEHVFLGDAIADNYEMPTNEVQKYNVQGGHHWSSLLVGEQKNNIKIIRKNGMDVMDIYSISNLSITIKLQGPNGLDKYKTILKTVMEGTPAELDIILFTLARYTRSGKLFPVSTNGKYPLYHINVGTDFNRLKGNVFARTLFPVLSAPCQ